MMKTCSEEPMNYSGSEKKRKTGNKNKNKKNKGKPVN